MLPLARSIARHTFPLGRFGATQFFSSKCKGPPNTCTPPPPVKKCSASGKEVALMEPACKIALITGGSSGIGLAIAQQLLCAGLQKAILASNSPCEGEEAVDALNEEFGQGKAVFYEVDVNCNKQFESLMKESISKFQRIDIMVNAAGILNDKCWELQVDTNLKSVARGTILAMKYMAKDGSCNKGKGGVVVNIAGTFGMIPQPTIPIYTATKHGVIGITRSFGDAYHFENTNLRVLALCPGHTKTKESSDVEDRCLSIKMGIDTMKTFKALPSQTAQEVGKAGVYVIKYGTSASCYIVEAGDIFHFTFPCQKAASNYLKSVR